jgi:hypothetical protein
MTRGPVRPLENAAAMRATDHAALCKRNVTAKFFWAGGGSIIHQMLTAPREPRQAHFDATRE